MSYYQDWEKFVIDFHKVQGAWQRSVAAFGNGRIEEARREIERSPGRRHGAVRPGHQPSGATRGEKGILVTLNLRWLPFFVSQRQALGMEPLRVRFARRCMNRWPRGTGKNSFRLR